VALDSIAKLSVLITGDESPLARSMVRAEQAITGSSQRMHRSGVQLSTVFSAMRGNVPALFKTAGTSAVGVLALATATYKLAAAGDRLNEAMGAGKLDTWAGQWDRLSASVSNAAGIIGGPLTTAFRDATADFATWTEQFNNWAAPEKMAAVKRHLEDVVYLEGQAARQAQHAVLVKEAWARANKLSRDLLAAQARERDEMSDFQHKNFSRADAIRDMVRTPAEELNRFAIELRSLFASGFIDQETMNRALEMAEQKARDAVESKQGAAAKSQQGVAAVERFTTAGFTAVQQAQSNMRVQEEHKRVAQQGVRLQQEEVTLSQKILQTLSQFPTTAPFALSRLN